MQSKLFIFIIGLTLIVACKKEEDKTINYPINYKLSGKYFRDSSITSNGYKMLDLTTSSTYCWLRRANSKDSLYCYGSYLQTSDTSMIWNGTDVIKIRITPIDSIQNGVKLEIFGTPIVPALFGFANQK